jgi:hypothetical protein
MKCPVCTAEIPSTAKFCGGCGATITKPKSPKPAATPPKPVALQPKPVAEPSNPAAAPEKPNPIASAFSSNYVGNPASGVEKKYKALRLIAMLYKVFAFVAGGGCVLLSLFMIVSSFTSNSNSTLTIGPDPTAIFGGAVGGLLLLVFGAFLFVFLYGLGEWMYVFMDIEENTRKTNEMFASRQQASS